LHFFYFPIFFNQQGALGARWIGGQGPGTCVQGSVFSAQRLEIRAQTRDRGSGPVTSV